jgi:hypothetical protein
MAQWRLEVYEVPGRKIVNTEGFGQANAQDIRNVTDIVVKKGKSFGGKWGYIPMIENMDPIFDQETQKEFAVMHQRCEESGCVAMGFVAGGMAAIKVQAKRHQKASNAEGLVDQYFRTREEALEWMKTFDL